MGKKKPILSIQNGEKELYRVFKELERYGRSVIDYPDNRKKQAGLVRSIGTRGSHLTQKKPPLLIPPTVSRYYKMNTIVLPVGVEVVEKKTKNGSKFIFQRIQ